MICRLIVLFFTAGVGIGQVFASSNVRMDIQSQNALIEKLESIRTQNTLGKIKKAEIEARLADMYAERARLKEMAAGEKNCNECIGFKSDRILAAQLYASAKGLLDRESDGRLRIQLAHMYVMSQNSLKAQQALRDILNQKNLTDFHPKAHLMLGEIAFENGEMSVAQKEYQAALASKSIDDQLYAKYRLAWAILNHGNDVSALIMMKQALIMAKGHNKTAFQKDIARDYATMLARQAFTAEQVDEFLKLSLAQDATANLHFLGEESERVGNKRGSLLIWNRYTSREENEKSAVAETQLKLAQNYYDVDDVQNALAYVRRTVLLIKDEKCENCVAVQKELRLLLISWTKKEKTEPSVQLSNAYDQYLELENKDFQAIVWAAQVARERKDFARAFRLYNLAVQLSQEANIPRDLEMALNSSIEVAEKSKNTQIYEQALEQYLALNPKGPLAGDILFQRAVVKFKNKKYQEAAQLLEDIALNQKQASKAIRLQAAELSIEAVSHLKDHSRVRAMADEYAALFPESQKSFSDTSRKVTVNLIVVNLANKNGPNEAVLKRELDRAQKDLNLSMSDEDRVTQLRTILLASDRVKDLAALENAAFALSQIKNIKPSDRSLALRTLLYIYESKLDFKRAYEVARKMSPGQLGKDHHELRLGLLAELAGKNPDAHFLSYLKSTTSIRNANMIRLKMIRKSRFKWAEFDKMFARIRITPDLLAEITLELHLEKQNLKEVRRTLSVRGTTVTEEGRFLKDLIRREEFSKRAKSISQLRIARTSDRLMQRSIRSRIQTLDGLRAQYALSLSEGHIVLQGMILNSIQKENGRFAREILALPAPRGLRASERKTYRELLAQQASPYLKAADEAKDHLSQLFVKNQKSMDKILEGISGNDLLTRKVAQFEVKSLRTFMEKKDRKDVDLKLAQAQSVSLKDVRIAYREIEKNPLDPSTLEELRDLEVRRANGPLIAYLDQRIAQLKAEARR